MTLLTNTSCCFLIVFCWIASRVPERYPHHRFRLATRFCMLKLSNTRWWFGLLHIARSLGFGLASTLSPDDMYLLQAIILLFFLLASLALHLRYLPYHDHWCNDLKTLELSAVICVLVSGCWFLTTDSAEDSINYDQVIN